MKLYLTLALLLAFGCSIRAEDKPEWLEPLKGGDLTKHWKTTGNWKLDKEGVVALEPRSGESGWTRYDAYLWLSGEYKDFECEFDYKVQKGGNSGFYLHVGDVKKPVETGIEVQIYDSGSKKEGDKLTDHDSGGIIPGLPPKKNTAKPAGEWNHFQITAKGDTLTVKLNGEVVNEVDMTQGGLKSRPKSGGIGFQDHGLPLALKDFKIRKL